MKKFILFIAFILSLCVNVAKANGLEFGIKAYQKGNYAQALDLLRPVANQGIAEAQNYVGKIYAEGRNNITRETEASIIKPNTFLDIDSYAPNYHWFGHFWG